MTTRILEYLPTKQIVNLYRRSNAIATPIKTPSHVINSNIKYNNKVNYSKFHTNQFAMYTTGTGHYRNRLFKKFTQTAYTYKPEIAKLYNEIDTFNLSIQNYNNINFQFDKYYMKRNMHHDMHNKKCNDVPSTDCSNSNRSLHLEDAENLTIKDTTINHLILTKCKNITIESKIKGNVVMSSCKNIKFKQRQLNDVRMLSTCLGCDFANVRTYDLSECKIDLDIFPQYDRYDSTNNINVGYVENLITRAFDTAIYKFKSIRTMKYLSAISNTHDTSISDGVFCIEHVLDNYDIVELDMKTSAILELHDLKSLEKLTVSCEKFYFDEHNDRCMWLKYLFNNIERERCIKSVNYISSDTPGLRLDNCSKLKVVNINQTNGHILFDIRRCENLEQVYIYPSDNYVYECPKMRGVKYL